MTVDVRLVVDDGIEAALERAFAAAGGDDVRLGGGVATIQQYLRAGLIDEMRVPRCVECRAQVSGGIPIISRNSSVVLVTGNGSAGTGSPSRSQIGSHPSPRLHSNSRSAGTAARTASL